jgi:hypothetical protein
VTLPAQIGAFRGAAAGLVNLSTSDTPVVENPLLEIDTEAARLKRMRRRVCKAAQLHQSDDLTGLRPAMVTLTYRQCDDWNGKHVSEAIKRCRQWLARRGHRMRYVWTAELQERGAIHYHIVTWLPDGQDRPPFWDKQGWWPHGSSRSEWARNAVGYIVSYASKVLDKQRLPCGARMHGAGGFTPHQRKLMAFHARPTWLRLISSVLQKVRREKGGGVVQHFACGLKRRIPSPYVLVTRSTGRVVLALRGTPSNHIRDALGDLWQTRYQLA